MKDIKILGIAWSLGYFALGFRAVFTLGINDTWATVSMALALSVLPVPITIIAIWFPRIAGTALFGCIAVNVIAVVYDAVSRHTYSLANIGRIAPGVAIGIAMYYLPHLFFWLGLHPCRAYRATEMTGDIFPKAGYVSRKYRGHNT